MRHATDNRLQATARGTDDSGSGPPSTSGRAFPGPADTADYACDILAGLRTLTSDARLRMLTYLIDMAYEEAASLRGESRPDGTRSADQEGAGR